MNYSYDSYTGSDFSLPMSGNNQEQFQPNVVYNENRDGEHYVESDYAAIGNLPDDVENAFDLDHFSEKEKAEALHNGNAYMKYLNPDYSNYNIEALLEEGRKYFDSFEDVRSLGNAESIQMWHENYQLDQDLLERIKLPPKKEGDTRHTLVLDLDETLIRHVDDIPKFDAEIFMVESNSKTDPPEEYPLRIRYRPYLFQFLAEVSKLYEVVVFTAAQKEYAESVVHLLNSVCNCIEHIRYYNHVTYVPHRNNVYYKDLRLLGRDMSKTFIIDNCPTVYAFNPDNAIPIKSWYFEEDDKELFFLASILRDIAKEQDVRPVLQATYNLRKLVENSPIL